MILLPWLIYTKQWKKIPSLLNPLAILLFLLIVSPWLYLVQSKYPQFLHYFLLINNLIVLVQKSLITNSHGVLSDDFICQFLPWLLRVDLRL